MIELAMRADDLERIPNYPLPEGCGWRFYRPGDARRWGEIEASAEGLDPPIDGLANFRRCFPSDELFDQRMIFLMADNIPVATSMAWYSERDPTVGRLHWVNVDAAYQGRGLSRPLLSITLNRMRELGHRSACLTTQTASWVAIKLYHEFGFRPMRLGSADERAGWAIVSEKTGVDFVQTVSWN